MKIPGKQRRILILLVALVVGFSSCRTAREIRAGRLKAPTPEKLLKLAEQRAFNYNDLTIRRMNCQFINNQSKTNFRVNLKAIKDEKILVSISKINIPVGRVLLTPDSVTYVNYIDRNYFVDDYTYLSNFLNFNVNFETIQSIISSSANGEVFFPDNSKNNDLRTFESFAEDGRYVLQSVNKTGRFNAGKKENSIPGNLDREMFEENNILFQKMVYNPGSYALEKLILDDQANEWKLEVNFSDFVQLEKKNFPGAIEMKMVSSNDIIEVKIKLNGFSTEKIDTIRLSIPDRYEQIRVN